VLGDQQRGETSSAIATYVDILCQEIAATPSGPLPLQTVFFGGGTPSLLSVPQVDQILRALEQQFCLASQPEISIEMDPGTFSLAQMQGLKALGINRVSLGVQTFVEELLQACGRSHTVSDSYNAIAILHSAQITNYGLDLISGLPHQTLEQWQATLKAAIDLEPTHLSTYDLVVEPQTVFGKNYQPGELPLPTEATTAQMYRLAATQLRAAGYDHYEISNYARPGYACRHNQVYWQNDPYYGFGMGATSYVHRQRCTRPRNRKDYRQWVQTLMTNNGNLDGEISSTTDILLETLMMGLRLAAGLPLATLEAIGGSETVDKILNCLAPFQAEQWVDLPTHLEGAVRLTDPEGFLFSNTVLTALWRALDP
jgi:oxygen-independent coproporphyrinogen-3 oxidase